MIYYSHRTRKALAEGQIFLPLGFAHYSYGTVCRKFLDVFEAAKIPAQELTMPEIYASARDVFPRPTSARPLHIAFKPYEEIRLLKGAANVAHVAWEFGRLPVLEDLPHRHPRRHNIMNDFVHTLGLATEVWVGCTYTKQVFEAQGVKNVQIVPAPIVVRSEGRDAVRAPALALQRIGSLRLTQANIAMYTERGDPSMLDGGTLFQADNCSANGGRVFLSILNPGDPRKNVAALLLGFQEFIARSGRQDLLIVKLVLDGSKGSLRRALSEHLPKHMDEYGVPATFLNCENIMVVRDHLSADDLAALYQAADFYVCASAAEGQGLPLQEAMAAGLVPISSRETAMGDYVDETNGIVMPTNEAAIPMQVSNAYGLWNLRWRAVDHRAIAHALETAVNLAPDAYATLSRHATQRIRQLYGPERITGIVADRVRALAA